MSESVPFSPFVVGQDMDSRPSGLKEDDAGKCPVCGNAKWGHQKHCIDCERQQEIIAERRRQRKRDEAFGALWPGRE